MQERLQKILSVRGICSRRKAEEYILEGLVTVNGKKAELGQKADPEIDVVEVDGSVIEARKDLKYYLLNKPIGIVTTNAEMSGQKTLIDILPKDLQGKVFAVGRLDKETSGLLLLTNDGVLAYRLTHPKFDHEKEYEVEVFEPITDGAIMKLEKGITISGEKTKPTIVKRIDENKFSIALTEGKNRQIRRMCQKVGKPVTSLKRIRIMTLSDSSMKQGDLRELTNDEKEELLKSVGI
jgi:pseudouridine synthase